MDKLKFNALLSDFLDNKLSSDQKKEFLEYLQKNKNKEIQVERLKKIIKTLHRQEFVKLPNQIKNAPFSTNPSYLETQKGNREKSKWQRTPWFVRSSVEGLGIALLILAVVAMVPQLKELYEKGIERQLEAYQLGELEVDIESDIQNDETVETQTGDLFDEEQEEENAEDKELPTKSQKKSTIRVGNSQTWRFIIKTDSPAEMKENVMRELSSLEKLKTPNDGIEGVEAPGGIQFNFLVPKSAVIDIKNTLEDLASHTSSERKSSEIRETFTWYKNKVRKGVPPGRARIVIWLSQI